MPRLEALGVLPDGFLVCKLRMNEALPEAQAAERRSRIFHSKASNKKSVSVEHMYTYVCIYIYIRVCYTMHACIHANMCIYVYTHVSVFTYSCAIVLYRRTNAQIFDPTVWTYQLLQPGSFTAVSERSRKLER